MDGASSEPGSLSISYQAPRFSLGRAGAAAAPFASVPVVAPSLLAFKSLGLQDAERAVKKEGLPGVQVLRSRSDAPGPSPAAADQTRPTDALSTLEAPAGTQKPAPAAEQEQPRPQLLASSSSPVEPNQGLGEFIEIPTGGGASPEAAPPTANGQTKAAADVSDADIEAVGRRPYWMRTCRNISSPFLRLHQEVVELVELLQPSEEEVVARNAAVAAVAEAVQGIWPTATVHVFGSFATGLYVPTSDVDLVVLDSRCTDLQAGLKALAAALMRRQVAKNVQVIAKARVPIVKFETTEFGGLAFDVSFDVANGPQSAGLVKEFCGKWPMMRPLVLVLKLFLQQRELNEVYSGGIGSYALITMVAAFLQLHTSRRPKAAGTTAGGASSAGRGSKPTPNKPPAASLLEPSLGVLLVDFFRLYGRVLNVPEVGVATAGGGCFFHKGDKRPSWYNRERPFMMAVEDPKDPDNDVGRNSYNVRLVKGAFDFAYQQLTAPCGQDESMLARILRLGAILVSRKPPVDRTKLYSRPVPIADAAGGGALVRVSSGATKALDSSAKRGASTDVSEREVKRRR